MLKPCPVDGAYPLDFYATTNLPTRVHIEGRWIPVQDIEMDCAILYDPNTGTARCATMNEVKQGDLIWTGEEGVEVEPLTPAAGPQEAFSFMGSEVSTEKPKTVILRRVAEEMRQVRARGGEIVFVGGPAIVHTGSGPFLEQLIAAGYVQYLFAGNALAAHDIEWALHGTSLGVDLETGESILGGHAHHLRAINLIRSLGGIGPAVEQGVLRRGIMHAVVKHGVPYVLAASIRDDGPLPDVMNDAILAQNRMREIVRRGKVEMAVMVSTMLHSIATGNLLPARVRTITVDINPSAVTKLADRGTFQAIGIVSDAHWFLGELVRQLTGAASPVR